MFTAWNTWFIDDWLIKSDHCADVTGRSGRAGLWAEGSDYGREPAREASWPEPAHRPGGGQPAEQPSAVWL